GRRRPSSPWYPKPGRDRLGLDGNKENRAWKDRARGWDRPDGHANSETRDSDSFCTVQPGLGPGEAVEGGARIRAWRAEEVRLMTYEGGETDDLRTLPTPT